MNILYLILIFIFTLFVSFYRIDIDEEIIRKKNNNY